MPVRLRDLRALLTLATSVAAALAGPVRASPVPADYEYSHAWFKSTDGTQLHAGVFLPSDRKPNERHPVLLTSTPYASPNGGASAFSNGAGPAMRFPELFEHPRFRAGRWAYVQVDVRGFGGSGGCFGYYLPPEAADVKVAVEWAAKAPWSTGKVGMWGKSYDAAQQVLALGARPKGLAATVIQAPGLSGYTALWMNGVHYATGRYATTAVYTVDDVGPAQNIETATSPEYAAATASGLSSSPTCRSDALVNMNVDGDRGGSFWKGKEPYLNARGSAVPTLWSHGFWDANTKPVHLAVWSALKGPKQAWFGQYTHLRGHEQGVGRDGFLDESFRFLDRHVRGLRVKSDPAVTVQSGHGEGPWRTEPAWPPTDAFGWGLPVRAGSYEDAPTDDGEGHWTMTTPLRWDAHLAGEITLTAKVTTTLPGAHLVAHVYDIDADGEARLVTRGAMALRGMGAQTPSYALYPQDWIFQKGHRIAVHLSASDTDWFSPPTTQARVAVNGGTAKFPLLRYVRDRFIPGEPSNGMNSATLSVSQETRSQAAVPAHPPAQRRR